MFSDYFTSLISFSIQLRWRLKYERKTDFNDKSFISDHEMANKFFIDKVEKIRSNVNSDDSAVFEEANACQSDHMMNEFQTLSCKDVRKIIMQFPNKSCSLDSLPTWILKDNLHVCCRLLLR